LWPQDTRSPFRERRVIAVSMRKTPRNEKSRRGFPGRLGKKPCRCSCLACPPDVQIRAIAHLRRRTFSYLAIAITAKQTRATGRKRGFCRKAWWLANDQHDEITLNSALFAVKEIFSPFAQERVGIAVKTPIPLMARSTRRSAMSPAVHCCYSQALGATGW